jgi:hypothetical protein
MKPSGHLVVAYVCWAAYTFTVLECTASVESRGSRESRRVQPVFENSIIEKPFFARPGKDRPNVIIPPSIEFPPLEKMLLDRPRLERSIRETPSFETPDTVDIFCSPRDVNRTEGFSKVKRLRIPRHYVPGCGNNLSTYRLGTRERIRGQFNPYNRHYLRNANERKLDRER